MTASPQDRTGRKPWGPPRLLAPLLFVVVAAVCAWGAASLMFSTYMFYDDEGYVLYSYNNYIQHGGLYRDVYSQYGPAPYAWYGALHSLLGFPVTHEAGRYLTLAFWLGAGIASALVVRRLTRTLAAPAFALAATVIYLWPMMSEPSHPGGLIVALTTAGGLGGAALWQAGRRRSFALLCGAVAAALALTKINVGAFFLVSCAAFMALQGEAWLDRRLALRLCVGAFVLLPFALMARLLGQPWVATFAVFFSLGAVSSLLVAGGAAPAGGGESDSGRGALPLFFAAAWLLVAGAIAASVMSRGSSLADLWEGIVAGPLRHPNAFSMEFRWRPGAWPAAIVSAGLFAWCLRARLRAHSEEARRTVDRWVAGLRLALLAGAALLLSRFPEVSPDTTAFSFLHATLWLVLWPLESGGDRRSWQARVWVGLVVLGQSLHPYPVPGSQISWGTFLIVTLHAVSWVEAAAWWVREEARARRLAWVVPAVLALSTAFSLACLKGFDSRMKDSEPLRLEGTGPLRLPLTTVATYHAITTNAAIHGDQLFSAPGMFSLNLWTGLPTPTHANVTHWFALLSAAQQGRIIEGLAAEPRAVVVSHREHAAFLAMIGYPPKGPLWDYVQGEMPVAFRIDDWEFRVHRGRTVAPYLTGTYLRRPGAGPDSRDDGRIELLIPSLPVGAIHALEVCCLKNDRGEPLRLAADNARVTFQPVKHTGGLDAAEQPARLPWKPDRPVRLNVHFATAGHRLDAHAPVVRLLGADGGTITFVRLVE